MSADKPFGCPFECGFDTDDVDDMSEHLDNGCSGSDAAEDEGMEPAMHPAYDRLVELRSLAARHVERTPFDQGLLMAYDEAIRLLDQHGRV